MLNFIRSFLAARYAMRVSLNLGDAQGLTNPDRFPSLMPLVRRSRINGLSPLQCAQMLRHIVQGADAGSLQEMDRDAAINAAMELMEGDQSFWKRPA